MSCKDAYAKHGLEPLVFSPKEHLGLLNGTAFSAAVASLALNDAVHLALLTQVLTAMGTEAMVGVQGNKPSHRDVVTSSLTTFVSVPSFP